MYRSVLEYKSRLVRKLFYKRSLLFGTFLKKNSARFQADRFFFPRGS